MKKRSSWTKEENIGLMKIVKEATAFQADAPLKWEQIATEMESRGFQKSSKQCRERFYKKMDPKTKPRNLKREVVV